MQAQPQVAEAVEVFGKQELTLEPQVSRPLVAQPTPNVPSAVYTPTDLINIAMQSGDKDVDRLERLMAMDIRYREQQALEHQRRREELELDRQRAALLAFREDFISFRAENIIVPLTKHVDRGLAGSFEQAEYHRIADMLTPALAKHGFGFRHKPDFTSRKWLNADGVEQDIPWVVVTCFLEHRKTHVETVTLEGPSSDLRGCTPMQNMQATASYLKRHSLLAITGTATGGEDDENGMGTSPQAAAARGSSVRQADAPAGANTSKNVGGTPQYEQLLDVGRGESMKGMAALTTWWAGLRGEQRDLIMSQFGSLKKAAVAADGARA